MNRCAIVLLAALSVSSLAVAGERLFVYPALGQGEQRQADDRYHCHRWAVAATGFDPLQAGLEQPDYVRVPVPDNPARGATGKGLLSGAVAGAAIGEIDAGNPGRGAAIGAVVGAVLGHIVEHEGEEQSRQEARDRAARIYTDRREVAIGRAEYRRALTACLEGRGYVIN